MLIADIVSVIHEYTCNSVMWHGYTRNLWQMWPLSFSHNYNPLWLCNDSGEHSSAVTRPRPVSGLWMLWKLQIAARMASSSANRYRVYNQ